MSQSTKNSRSAIALKKAFVAIENLENKLQEEKNKKNEPIAIIGMSCRFPGSAASPDQFWNMLVNGVDGVKENQRWQAQSYVDKQKRRPGTTCTLKAGFIDDFDAFDAGYFGISPREAETIDPQQRLALELSACALEQAGYRKKHYEGSNTGVFMGVGISEYLSICEEKARPEDESFFGTGNSPSVVAGRVAYSFGLQGPTMAIDTACSSSLVAVHNAITSLRAGECNMALAGGVNLLLHPKTFVSISQAEMLSADGACKTFDAKANGYVRAEGGGVIMLKPLSTALADGDHIHGVIRGSAVNQDGRSSSLTTPSGPAQQQVIRKALTNAGVNPKEVSVVETHGTGTALGDPIEIHALDAVYGPHRHTVLPLVLGALKSNIGHAEAASGIGGLIKLILSIQHKTIAPNLHFTRVNPNIQVDENRFSFPTKPQPWPTNEGTSTRIGAVSSFGFSGTNVHMVVQEYCSPQTNDALRSDAPEYLLTVSAKSKKSFQQRIEQYRVSLLALPEEDMANFCYSVNACKDQYAYRTVFKSSDRKGMISNLDEFIQRSIDDIEPLTARRLTQMAPCGFLFTGQGSQYIGMGKELYGKSKVFSAAIDRCCNILDANLPHPLLTVMWNENSELINETQYTQPALFTVEYALSQLWLSWGVKPEILMGHSIGEIVAACIAGIFDLEDALRLVAARGRLMQELKVPGSMSVVMAPADLVRDKIQGLEDHVSIAAYNTPSQTVLSGDKSVLVDVVKSLEKEDIRVIPLKVSHGFHSPMMLPIREEFSSVAEQLTYHQPQINIVSNVNGEVTPKAMQSAQYWVDHAFAPVYFYQSITEYVKYAEVIVEIGPKPILTGLAKNTIKDESRVWVPSFKSAKNNYNDMLGAVTTLYQQGVELDWGAMSNDAIGNGVPVKKLPLPTYPFDYKRYWVDGNRSNDHQLYYNDQFSVNSQPQSSDSFTGESDEAHPLLGRRLALPMTSDIRFENHLNAGPDGNLSHHRLFDVVVVPGAAYVSMVLAAISEAFLNIQCNVKDVVFYQTIAIPDGNQVRVQLALKQITDKGYEFQIVSLLKGADPHCKESWITHADGRVDVIDIADTTIANTVGNATESIDEVLENWRYEHDNDAFYHELREKGYLLGSAYRWLDGCWRSGDTVVHKIVVPETPDAVSDYPLYPGLIDSCFQTIGALIDMSLESDEIYIPFNIESLNLQCAPLEGDSLWVKTSILPTDDRIIGNISLFTEKGDVIFDASGIEIRKAKRANLQRFLQAESETDKSCSYTESWLKYTITANTEDISRKNWLVLSDENAFTTGIVAELKSRGATVRVTHSPVSGNVEQMMSEAKKHLGTIDGVFYGWGLYAKNHETDPAKAVVDQCVELTEMVQVLAGSEVFGYPKFVMATVEGCVTGCNVSKEDVDPLQASAWGFGKVTAAEHPELNSVLVDVELSAVDEVAEALATLLLYSENDKENKVALRTEGDNVVRCWVPRLKEIQAAPKSHLDLNVDYTYLVTGGCSGLGLKVAQWLVSEKGVRSIVLTRRSPLQEDAKIAIPAMKSLGAKVTVVKTDIGVKTDIARLFDTLGTLPQLRGVVHAAGVISDRPIQKIRKANYERVMAAKVTGTWWLHQYSKDIPLDFFLVFSSAASTIGTPGQVNYAAGNAYMDGLMHNRAKNNLVATSINWGPWDEVGMAARDHSVNHKISDTGMRGLSVERGLALMEEALMRSDNQQAIFDADWPVFLERFPGGSSNEWFSYFQEKFLAKETPMGNLLRDLESAEPEDRCGLLEQQVCCILKDILRLDEEENLASDQGFFGFGMDSLTALEFKNRLDHGYDIRLTPTVAFTYPNIGELIEHLADDMLEIAFNDGEEDTELDDLSEDEIAEILAEQLNEISAL